MAPSKTTAMGTNSARAGPTRRYRVKLECSPNGRAKCKFCLQKIQKNQQRLMISRGSRTEYYHKGCLPRAEMPYKHDPQFETALTDELFRLQSGREPTLESRADAAAARAVAHSRRKGQMDRSPEIIVIDDSDDEDESNNHAAAVATGVAKQSQGVDDSDDDEILCEETLTNAQVIQQKFDRAAANGEIVSID